MRKINNTYESLKKQTSVFNYRIFCFYKAKNVIITDFAIINNKDMKIWLYKTLTICNIYFTMKSVLTYPHEMLPICLFYINFNFLCFLLTHHYQHKYLRQQHPQKHCYRIHHCISGCLRLYRCDAVCKFQCRSVCH